ncbi:PaaI family thioesterase [Polaromonas eurypsychrophila]|uniref:Thioesterase n=1 Tax=Polaromonas eurypsychrophila TaxID=1614635 RepID=A0A916WHD3_9BURK|nr:PaaI family thioesterase [Polaromonas eurypsychrophila]GGB01391.1 thioesterase [Polaromonas eurypsychrophila]
MPDTASFCASAIPNGFVPVSVGGPFIEVNGPFYARLEGQQLLLGFRVEERHSNPLQMCHGGMLASFADMLLPCAAMYQTDTDRRFLPTISLQIDYLAPARLGAWVQGQAEILRSTRNMIFIQGLVTADGEPALRISGIFKQGPLIGDGKDHDPFLLRS